MESLIIRQANIEDKNALMPQILLFENQHAQYEGGHLTDESKTRAEESFERDTKKNKYWVAEVNNQVVGFIKAEIIDTRPDTLLLDNLFVEESFRKQGIGTALIHFVEDIFRSKGAKKSQLWVAKMNTTAESLYQKLGFEFREDIWKQYEKEL